MSDVAGSEGLTPRVSAAEAARAHLRRMARRHALALLWIPALGAAATVPVACWLPVGAMEIALFVIFYSASLLGITVGFHRLLAHGAFKCGDRVRAALAILGSMAGQGTPLYWVATHRRHHARSDEAGDPHSPNLARGTLAGLWHAQAGWMLEHAHPDTTTEARDLLRDRAVGWVNRRYPIWVLLGLVLPAIADALVHRAPARALPGLLWGGLLRIFVAYHFTAAVNSLCHRFGSRPFATGERSTNLAILALPTFGEAWHNNHHAFPSSARLGHGGWQIDLGRVFISLLSAAGLAWSVKEPRRPRSQAAPNA